MPRYPYHSADAFRGIVGSVFAAFRKHNQGVARVNHMCCSGCASADLASKPQNHGKPCVFMHAQDQHGFADGSVFVKFGWIHNDQLDRTQPFTKDDAEVGRMLTRVAEAHGLIVEWDGTEAQCVRLYANWSVYAVELWERCRRFEYTRDEQRALALTAPEADRPGHATNVTWCTQQAELAMEALRRCPVACLPDVVREELARRAGEEAAWEASARAVAGGAL